VLIVTGLRYCKHQKRLTYITNDVLTSNMSANLMFALDLHRPRRLAYCEVYSRFCSKHPPKKTYSITKYRSVVNVLTICIGKISANASELLKPVLQV
jgi:hypothetical protein